MQLSHASNPISCFVYVQVQYEVSPTGVGVSRLGMCSFFEPASSIMTVSCLYRRGLVLPQTYAAEKCRLGQLLCPFPAQARQRKKYKHRLSSITMTQDECSRIVGRVRKGAPRIMSSSQVLYGQSIQVRPSRQQQGIISSLPHPYRTIYMGQQ
jgi:hypothetical protein